MSNSRQKHYTIQNTDCLDINKENRQRRRMSAVFLSYFTEASSFGASSSAAKTRIQCPRWETLPMSIQARRPVRVHSVSPSALTCPQCQEQRWATQCPHNCNFRHQQQPARSADNSASCVGRTFSVYVMTSQSADTVRKSRGRAVRFRASFHPRFPVRQSLHQTALLGDSRHG